MRLLIECTFVYENPETHTGIQRVVRNVVSRLGQVRGVECVPVLVRGAQLRRVTQLIPDRKSLKWLPLLERVLRRIVSLCWMLHARYDSVLGESPVLHKIWLWCCRLLSAPAVIGMKSVKHLKYRYLDAGRSEPIQPQRGDVLVLLDVGWQMTDRSMVESCRARGVLVVAVIYDLIPLTHPQFCNNAFIYAFSDWFAWIARHADGFMAISSTVRDEVRTQVTHYCSMPHAIDSQGAPWFDYFHLGTELDCATANAEINPAMVALFVQRPVYLMVSTIEPRKNHAYLLDAFELLWAAGQDVALCFIGRSGWKNKALMQRIASHAELDRRLFVFGNADDSDLEYAYRHARALVFPSIVEGFGLPLVEAMQRGLPAMVSDIPIFREVGQDYVAYFDLLQPQTLADLVQSFDASGIFPAALSLQGWSWPDWDDATAQLTQRILMHCKDDSTVDASAVHVLHTN
ncbi:MAG: glycosyltransferase family 4 protein [Burkholderiaceae bacterium]